MTRPAETVLGGTGPSARDFAVWGAAALAAVLVHLAVVVGLYAAVPDDDGHEAFEEAMLVDLAPMPIASTESVAPDMLVEDSPEENLEPVEEVVEVARAETAPTLDPVEPLPPDDVAPEAVTEPVTEAVPETVETIDALEPVVEPVETVDSVDEVAPEPVEQEVVEAEPVEQEVVEQETTEPEAVEPDPVQVAEIPPPELMQEVTEPEIVESEIVEAITPEVEIPLPQPRPERVAEASPQPPARKRQRDVAQKQAPKEEARPAPRKTRQAAAKPRSEAAATRSSQASTAPKVNPAKWHNQVRAAIMRRVGRVRGMRGTVRVKFVVSDSGSVVSASIAGSSGDGSLDDTAVRMVRQAQVPPPPAGIEGGRHAFSVPLTFK